MLIYFLIFILLVLLIGFCIYRIFIIWRDLEPVNQCPLQIHTFDGKDSPYHPSVLFFEGGWNHYKYYMVQTPFFCGYPFRGKNYRDRYECPSVYVSNDGIQWLEVSVNPIDTLGANEIENKDYFSDPHLVFTGDAIECWYRINHRYGDYENDNNVELLRKRTFDGVNWTERETLADLTTVAHPLGNMVISQSVLFLKNRYHMWYVDSISLGQREIAFSSSSDGLHWISKRICKLYGADINPWHIDVALIDNVFWLTIFDRINLTLWRSTDGLDFRFYSVLLSPSKIIGSFYAQDLYRACLIKNNELYRLYFSADDSIKTSIGVMEGKCPDELHIISIGSDQYRTFSQFLYVLFYIRIRDIVNILKRMLYRHFIKPIKSIIKDKTR